MSFIIEQLILQPRVASRHLIEKIFNPAVSARGHLEIPLELKSGKFIRRDNVIALRVAHHREHPRCDLPTLSGETGIFNSAPTR